MKYHMHLGGGIWRAGTDCYFDKEGQLLWVQASFAGQSIHHQTSVVIYLPAQGAHIQVLREATYAVLRNRSESALVALEPLAKINVPEALALLGTIYQVGQGVAINGPMAVELLSRAAELNDFSATHNLSSLYVAGLPGVEPNLALSQELWEKVHRTWPQSAMLKQHSTW